LIILNHFFKYSSIYSQSNHPCHFDFCSHPCHFDFCFHHLCHFDFCSHHLCLRSLVLRDYLLSGKLKLLYHHLPQCFQIANHLSSHFHWLVLCFVSDLSSCLIYLDLCWLIHQRMTYSIVFPNPLHHSSLDHVEQISPQYF